jgi:hypothetical protein
MKKVIQNTLSNRLSLLLMLCAMLFVAASCEDDDSPAVIAAPTLGNASAITATGFTVNWTAVTGADKYLLDVSTTNNFATTVTGFNKKEVTGTSTNVTGLTTKTKYYFRLYAKKGTATSAASVTKEATTL